MHIFELLILAVGVSMDACAVSVCKGLALRRISLRHCLWVGLWFGAFQALLPLAGYVLGARFRQYITSIDHWISFGLLVFLGIRMIAEAIKDEPSEPDAALSCRHMLILSLATSIDALALGVTFAFLEVPILPAICLIGVVTFILSAVSVKIGNLFGAKWKSGAELAGGIILCIIGCKILLDHLGFLPF